MIFIPLNFRRHSSSSLIKQFHCSSSILPQVQKLPIKISDFWWANNSAPQTTSPSFRGEFSLEINEFSSWDFQSVSQRHKATFSGEYQRSIQAIYAYFSAKLFTAFRQQILFKWSTLNPKARDPPFELLFLFFGILLVGKLLPSATTYFVRQWLAHPHFGQ